MPDIEFRASAAMRAVFRAAYGDPLDDEDRAQFHKLAGGRTAPADGAAEIEIVAGRGSTKTTVAGARFLVYEATQVPHEIALSPGQRGVLAIVSTEKTNQSAELLNAVKGLCQLDEIKPLVEGETENEVRFSTGVVIRKITADSKLLRGSRFVAAVIDEAAFLPWEGADPDTDIIRALRGGMTRIEGAPRRKLLAVSSAGPRKGWFYKNYEEHYGRNESPVLVFHGSTLDYNPATSREDLEAARARDPIGFQREYESQFIDVIADNWLGQSNIERCVDKGRTDAMPYELGLRYHIACDVGLEHDSTAIVVATSRWTGGDEQRSKQRRLTHVCYV